MKKLLILLLLIFTLQGSAQLAPCTSTNHVFTAGTNIIPAGAVYCVGTSIPPSTNVSSLVISAGAILRLGPDVSFNTNWWGTYGTVANNGTIEMSEGSSLNAATYSTPNDNAVVWIGNDCDKGATVNIYGSSGVHSNFSMWCCVDLVHYNGATNNLTEVCDVTLAANISELMFNEDNLLTIKWQVYSEFNTVTYILEYSNDNINWNTSNIISTHGIGTYQSVVDIPTHQMYYRIKEVDISGKETTFKSQVYSNIYISDIKVVIGSDINIYSEGTSYYYMYNLQGQLLSNGTFSNTTVLDKPKVPTLLKVVNQNNTVSKKIF